MSYLSFCCFLSAPQESFPEGFFPLFSCLLFLTLENKLRHINSLLPAPFLFLKFLIHILEGIPYLSVRHSAASFLFLFPPLHALSALSEHAAHDIFSDKILTVPRIMAIPFLRPRTGVIFLKLLHDYSYSF